MSLTALCVIVTVLILEFTLWFYVSHNTEHPIDRAKNLQGMTWSIAALSIFYLSGWVMLDATRFIDISPAFWLAGINGTIAIVITSLLVFIRPTAQNC
jgi:hypothetical protein